MISVILWEVDGVKASSETVEDDAENTKSALLFEKNTSADVIL